MENPTAQDSNVDSRPSTSRTKGKGAANRRQMNFRKENNDEAFADIQAGYLCRLKISYPFNLDAVQLQSSVPPARGLPRFVKETWMRMKAIGRRPFAQLAIDANCANFLKCIISIAESRIVYVQMKCDFSPPFPIDP